MDVDSFPSGELFIVMEYLEGHSSRPVAASRRGLPIAEAVGHILQACDALAEAHAQGIVHRDVKPANLFLTRAGSSLSMIQGPRLRLAKTMAPQAFTSGSAGALGTPQYMSPEQIRGDREVDARTDVWSIGATLYELLAGRAAFEGRSRGGDLSTASWRARSRRCARIGPMCPGAGRRRRPLSRA